MKQKGRDTRRDVIWPAIVLSLALASAANGAEAPMLAEPCDDAAIYLTIPHFSWQPIFEPKPDAMPSYVIQIASDPEFANVVDEDRLAAVITWYLPDRELAPGEYWWRAAGITSDGQQGPWSAAQKFTVRSAPEFRVGAGATFEDIQKVLREAASHTPARVAFDKGEYRLDPGGPKAFLDLTDAADLTIDGSGASVVLTRPAPIAIFTRCRRVLVKGFVFDYDPPVYTAGRVAAVDEKEGAIEIEILPGHSLPDAFPRYGEDRKGMVVTEAEGFAMKRGIPLIVSHTGFQRIEGRRYRFQLENVKHAAQLAAGDIYVLDPRWQNEAGGTCVKVGGGEDVVLYGLTIHGAANECLNSYYANRHAILHVRLERKPGRALTVNNGGNNHHNARTGPWIEGCLFENTGDDICHVNCLLMGVEAKTAANRVRLSLRNPYDAMGPEVGLDIREGDVLQFFNRAEGRLISERRVARVERLEQSLDVTLDGDVGDIVAGRHGVKRVGLQNVPTDATITQVFNLSRTCSQFVFRHNTCRSGRRVGVLAKGLDGLIEKNTFEGLGGGGVEFWNAPFEGLAAENYVVRGNTIRGCGRLKREHAAIWATIFKSGGSRCHRNILIEDNKILGFPGPAILLRDAENVVVRGNCVTLPEPAPSADAETSAIILSNTRDVSLESNTEVKP